jgi:hypothetical protein
VARPLSRRQGQVDVAIRRGSFTTATSVAPALSSIPIEPLSAEEELVVLAVLRVVSLAQRAVCASEDAPECS